MFDSEVEDILVRLKESLKFKNNELNYDKCHLLLESRIRNKATHK